MIRPVSDAAEHATPEDWRILRALSFYRLLLVTLQLVLYETGYLSRIFDLFMPRWFYVTCVIYALAALLLFIPILYRRPRSSLQAHGQFFVDLAAITSMAYACGGVPSGLGMLLLTSAVGCSLVLSPRMALVQAAGATLVVFGEEVVRQYSIGFDTAPFTQTGILGLMFFATSLAANTVAVRARKSEALAQRFGSDLASLSRLNERIIEQMQTGVLAVDDVGRIRLQNAAAGAWLGSKTGDWLPEVAPALSSALEHWRSGHPLVDDPLLPRAGAEEALPRFSRLGSGESALVLILLESAQQLREQARQIKLAALGRLSASIAHEIRNPLSAISHAGQLLAESPALSAENQRLLGMIQRHSERIDKIIKDVLGLSRRESVAPSNISLSPWLQGVLAQYLEGHPAQARTIKMNEVTLPMKIRFDASHLQQVLYNLWDNSFAHGAREGHKVEVSLRAGWLDGKHKPYLDIRDNGPGIPADLLERVFEPFFTTANQGTGLGLYLARELCEYNRARLIYLPSTSDSNNPGACFRLLFAELSPVAL